MSLKDEAIELLIEQIGNNLRQFDGELDKLKLIAYPEKLITRKMVEDIAISNQDLFNITEMIMKKTRKIKHCWSLKTNRPKTSARNPSCYPNYA